MAEEKLETKEGTEVKEDAAKGMRTFLKVILGLALIVVGGLLAWYGRKAVITLIKGCIGPFLILVGVIVLAIARE